MKEIKEFVLYTTENGKIKLEIFLEKESLWLSQKMMGTLYSVNIRTINEHLKKIFNDNELQGDSVIRNFRITATDGKSYNTKHYKK